MNHSHPTPQWASKGRCGNRFEETRARRIAGHDPDFGQAVLAAGTLTGGCRLKRHAGKFARAVLQGCRGVWPTSVVGKYRPALFLLFLPFVLATGCGSGFEAASADFHVAADRHARLLDNVLDAYTDASDARIAQLHARFLREGIFAQLDSLCDNEKILLEKMIGACRRRHARELTRCVAIHMNLCRRTDVAQIPFLYKRITPYVSEPELPEYIP